MTTPDASEGTNTPQTPRTQLVYTNSLGQVFRPGRSVKLDASADEARLAFEQLRLGMEKEDAARRAGGEARRLLSSASPFLKSQTRGYESVMDIAEMAQTLRGQSDHSTLGLAALHAEVHGLQLWAASLARLGGVAYEGHVDDAGRDVPDKAVGDVHAMVKSLQQTRGLLEELLKDLLKAAVIQEHAREQLTALKESLSRPSFTEGQRRALAINHERERRNQVDTLLAQLMERRAANDLEEAPEASPLS